MAGRDGSANDAKVEEYERFLNDRLRVDLQRAQDLRARLKQERDAYAQLAESIDALERDGVTSMRTLVNLGCEVYCQADVPDTSRLLVNVGLGFHADLTRAEARAAAVARGELLQQRLAAADEQVASIMAHIKLVAEGIRELSRIIPADPLRPPPAAGGFGAAS